MNSQGSNLLPLDVENWDSSLAHIIQEMNGRPLNVHKLMANHPQLLSAWWNFRNYSVAGGDLGRRNSELVILRVAIHLKSWYEWGSHVERSLSCGLTLDEINRIKQFPASHGWKECEHLLLKAIDELMETRSLAPTSYKALKRHFNDKQIMDVIAIHGMYIILGCMLDIWKPELDNHIAARLPDTVTKECFEAELKQLCLSTAY